MPYATVEAAREAATARDADGNLLIPAIFGALAIVQDAAGRCDLSEVAQPGSAYSVFAGGTHHAATLIDVVIQDAALAAAYGISA